MCGFVDAIGSNEINKSLRKEIGNAIKNNNVCIAAISLWEISMLESKRRVILRDALLRMDKKCN